jgi:hypothetical protein
MSSKGKRSPDPSSTQRKQQPVRTAGPAKARPRCLHGIDDEPGNGHPVWRLTLLDLEHDGEWSWDVNGSAVRKIVVLLREMERLTWKQVWALQTGGKRRGALHKFIPVESLCPAAQKRFLELRLEEFDQMFRFRLGNMERLWGVVYEGVFYPVWWDPDHKVCPSSG